MMFEFRRNEEGPTGLCRLLALFSYLLFVVAQMLSYTGCTLFSIYCVVAAYPLYIFLYISRYLQKFRKVYAVLDVVENAFGNQLSGLSEHLCLVGSAKGLAIHWSSRP
jgi:hypothetical protein